MEAVEAQGESLEALPKCLAQSSILIGLDERPTGRSDFQNYNNEIAVTTTEDIWSRIDVYVPTGCCKLTRHLLFVNGQLVSILLNRRSFMFHFSRCIHLTQTAVDAIVALFQGYTWSPSGVCGVSLCLTFSYLHGGRREDDGCGYEREVRNSQHERPYIYSQHLPPYFRVVDICLVTLIIISALNVESHSSRCLRHSLS